MTCHHNCNSGFGRSCQNGCGAYNCTKPIWFPDFVANSCCNPCCPGKYWPDGCGQEPSRPWWNGNGCRPCGGCNCRCSCGGWKPDCGSSCVGSDCIQPRF